MEGFFASASPERESSRSSRTHTEIVERDVMEDILVSGRRVSPAVPVPTPVSASTPWQSRSVRRRARRIVDGLFSELRPTHGDQTHTEVVSTLRKSLNIVDPDYARAQQALQVVDALRRGLARQGTDQTSRGVSRAIADLVSDGTGSGTYSATAASELLGISVARKRVGDRLAASTADSFGRQRKRHKQAFSIEVKKAVAEFAFAYCKYEEKEYVSVLPSVHVWDVYCAHHDRDGDFYAMGNATVHAGTCFSLCDVCIQCTNNVPRCLLLCFGTHR